jgi:hypothetical protein
MWSVDEFLDVQFRVGDWYPFEIRLSEHQEYGNKGLSCMGTVVRVALDRQQWLFGSVRDWGALALRRSDRLVWAAVI